MLISPFNMFISCGNSSILVFLINLPILVILGSFLILNIGPFLSFCFSNFSFISSAFTTIDLNLYILNFLLLIPTRSCENITGPFDSIFISMATTISIGANTISADIEHIISISRFKNSYVFLDNFFFSSIILLLSKFNSCNKNPLP